MTICETDSLIDACDLHPDDRIARDLVVTVQPHNFNSQSQCNQLIAFTKS